MPRSAIRINGKPFIVYQIDEGLRGGMAVYRRAERSLEDFRSRRRLVLTHQTSGYYQSDYTLEEGTFVVTWGQRQPEPIVDVIGPEPSAGWTKGTVRTGSGAEYQVDYRLSPHTKEQGEKVFRERLIDATAQGQMGMAERAAIHEERNRQLSEALVEAAGVARSGLLIPNGPLVEEMEPEEREFYNRLVQRDPATGKPLSLRELGKLMGISHTTVKRRWAALARKYPKLSRLITEARAPHAKGENPDAIPSDRQGQEDEAEE